MPFRSEKQRRYLWANEPKIAREWTDEYGSKPVKAKKGKYQEFKHPQHDILPIEHMEDKVSSKERIERLLEDRKSKKDTKKKLAKDGPHYVPGWKPNLSVKAAEGELVRQKTRGTGAAVKGVEHYTMKGMPTAYQGQLIQAPTRGTGAAVKGTDHYIMPGMDAAKTGKLIKAKKGIGLPPATKYTKYLKSLKKVTPTKLGYQLKGITPEKMMKKNRLPGNLAMVMDKGSASKKVLKSMSKTVGSFPLVKSKSFYFKDVPKASKLSTVLKTVGKRTAIGKVVNVAGKVALAGAAAYAGTQAYKEIKNLKKELKKKKVDKKSIGGETVVMKSGGGYIDNLL